MKVISSLLLIFLLASPLLQAKETIFLRQKGSMGTEGWTKALGKHSNGTPMNSVLVLAGPNRKTVQICAGYAFIEEWSLIEKDRFAVIRSRNSHGPARWEKFDAKSGKPVDEYYYSKDNAIPDWVRPLLDFTPP